MPYSVDCSWHTLDVSKCTCSIALDSMFSMFCECPTINECCLTVARSFQSSFDLTRSLSHISEVRTSVAHLHTHLPHAHHPASFQFYISSVCFLSFLISHFQSDESEFSQFNPTDSSTLKRSAVDDVTAADSDFADFQVNVRSFLYPRRFILTRAFFLVD